MICIFPTPTEVPYKVKQKILNHVFPKKESLIKRSFLVRTLSTYSLFLGVVVLFSLLYLKDSLFYSDITLDSSGWNIDPEIAFIEMNIPIDADIVDQNYIENNLSKETIAQETIVSSQDLDVIEATLSETENILKELETLI